ncbi:MAG: KOW domain-containing RNA-binding protein [Oscillospiraceae bacterium]|jgi:ribosomal protein L14E/L6E/L27E|nr:KOW domain-containing RNA-binding protein [Oscillospiraceae bacterium]
MVESGLNQKNLGAQKQSFESVTKFVRGVVVRSAAGRDRGDFQVILKTEKDYAFVCDGRHRFLENPKRKNRKHLFFTNTVLNEEFLTTNKLIRKSLRIFSQKI